MKLLLAALAATMIPITTASADSSQSEGYTNFIRQVIMGTTPPVFWDVTVPESGERLSLVPIDIAGSRYELWTVKTAAVPISYLLDTAYVSAYAPEGTVTIQTEDTDSPTPRTRADRPFTVTTTVKGLLSGGNVPTTSKSVNFLRHVQSYGETDGTNIDRNQATLHSQASIDRNGTNKLDYGVTAIPGSNRLTVRGEERFSIYSIKENGSSDERLDSETLLVWPVATASISGIQEGDTVRFDEVPLTFTLNNLYPKSFTYAQLYPGTPKLDTMGQILPAAQLAIDQNTPESRQWQVGSYSQFLNEDGPWTVEVVTETVFGIERLAYLTFNVNRSIKVNSMISTMENEK